MMISLIKPDREPDLVTSAGTKVWVKEMIAEPCWLQDGSVCPLIKGPANDWYYKHGNDTIWIADNKNQLEELWQWVQIEKALEL